ncbi:MAG: fibronectin type III domain-containing protein [candidate division WOR-3 bacterium]
MQEASVKKALYSGLSLVAGTAAALLAGCGVIGGPPANLQIAAASDTTVQLVWTTPAEGMPDSYQIYFCPAGETTFVLIGDTSTSVYIHNPHGITGRYQISAIFAGREYKSATILSTVPVYTPPKSISELDGTGNAGYGWDLDSGYARTYSMRQVGNAQFVHCYLTDFTTGTSGPYRLASPSMGPSDPSGVVPTANWDSTWLTNPLTDENAPLPPVNATTYFNYTTVPETALPALIGIYIPHENQSYFALLKVNLVNRANATVELESWLQPVPGLHLIYHR